MFYVQLEDITFASSRVFSIGNCKLQATFRLLFVKKIMLIIHFDYKVTDIRIKNVTFAIEERDKRYSCPMKSL